MTRLSLIVLGVVGALIGVSASVSACITYEDPCESFTCGDNEVCIALESGPQCTCADGATEADDGTCVAPPTDDADAGPVDAG